MKAEYQDEIKMAASLDLTKTIEFNRGSWTDRDIMCYQTAFAHGLEIAMRLSGIPERMFDKKGNQIN